MAKFALVLDGIAASQDWSVEVTTRRPVTRAEYLVFCADNPEMRIERSSEGQLIVKGPAHSRIGNQNAALTAQLRIWSQQDGTDVSFDSSTGFDLPDGSNRSPDASWVLESRIQALSAEQRKEFMEICPDFVVELRSSSDCLADLRAKMQEYLACGAQLGWLIDPSQRRVWIYRPGTNLEALDEPSTLSGDPLLPGFVLDLLPIWNLQI